VRDALRSPNDSTERCHSLDVPSDAGTLSRHSELMRCSRLARFCVPESAEPWQSILAKHPGLTADAALRDAIRYWDTGRAPDELKWTAWVQAESAAVRWRTR